MPGTASFDQPLGFHKTTFQPGNSDTALISNQISLKIVTSLFVVDVAVSGFEASSLSNNHLQLPQCLEGWSKCGSQERKMQMRAFPPCPTLHPFVPLHGGQIYPAPKSHENVILITARYDSAKT